MGIGWIVLIAQFWSAGPAGDVIAVLMALHVVGIPIALVNWILHIVIACITLFVGWIVWPWSK